MAVHHHLVQMWETSLAGRSRRRRPKTSNCMVSKLGSVVTRYQTCGGSIYDDGGWFARPQKNTRRLACHLDAFSKHNSLAAATTPLSSRGSKVPNLFSHIQRLQQSFLFNCLIFTRTRILSAFSPEHVYYPLLQQRHCCRNTEIFANRVDYCCTQNTHNGGIYDMIRVL